jgi:hypothetical protein
MGMIRVVDEVLEPLSSGSVRDPGTGISKLRRRLYPGHVAEEPRENRLATSGAGGVATAAQAGYDLVYADLPRAGLGNLLFPWARAALAAHQSGVELLPPKWFKFRVGPYLRGDIDKRRYQNLFRRAAPAAKARRDWLLRTGTLLSETGEVKRPGRGPRILTVQGMYPCFERIDGFRELIYERLLADARPGAIGSRPVAEPYVAVHIRLGDFRRPENDPGTQLINLATPVSWFMEALLTVRRIGWEGPLVVCSDGTDQELAPILRLPDVTVQRGQNALTDLMTLAGGRVVIGSGSSFSSWGAWLGGAPIYMQVGMNHFEPGDIPVREVPAWDSEPIVSALSMDLDGR